MSFVDLVHANKGNRGVLRDDFAPHPLTAFVAEDVESMGPTGSGLGDVYTLSLVLLSRVVVRDGMSLDLHKERMVADMKHELYKGLHDPVRDAFRAVSNGSREDALKALSTIYEELKTGDADLYALFPKLGENHE